MAAFAWTGPGPGLLAVGLDGTGRYINWGVIQISLSNLVVVILIIVLFIAALLLPFPGGRDPSQGPPEEDGP